ncbi:MAG: hypothetical protein M1830_008346 [Pleopsidium flavum]|nr:MAG: hypothetical protein M1830_008346 [Pleopsidium flavum]
MPPESDLTLPPKAPTEPYQRECHDISSLAIYILVDLREGGADELLKAVYHHHMELAKEGSYHPTLLIVAQHQEYKRDGVLLVNLDTNLECSVGTCRIKAEEAASALINITIANMEWEDFKEDELPSVESVTAGVESSAISSHVEPSQQSYESTPDYSFGAYTIAGANMTNIRDLLEPDWVTKSPKEALCRSICSYNECKEMTG